MTVVLDSNALVQMSGLASPHAAIGRRMKGRAGFRRPTLLADGEPSHPATHHARRVTHHFPPHHARPFRLAATP